MLLIILFVLKKFKRWTVNNTRNLKLSIKLAKLKDVQQQDNVIYKQQDDIIDVHQDNITEELQ